MRLSTLLTAAFLMLAGTTATAQTKFTEPVEYNNFIVAEQQVMMQKCLRYISKSAHSENEKKIAARLQDVITQNKLSLAKISHLPAFKGNTDFRDKAKASFQQMLSVYSLDYKKVNALAAGRTQSLEAMQQYFDTMEQAEAKLEAAGDSVEAAQQRFARQFGLTIQETPASRKMGETMRQISEVSAYHHKVYLTTFRLEKVNAAFSAALSKQDAAAFETARTQLEAAAEISAAELAALPAFRGKQNQYRDAAKNLANFYVVECGNDFRKLQELLVRKDQLTRADVEDYNRYIKTLNTQGQKFNEAYNKASTAFLDSNVPVFND
ncbi:hypothetical protein FY528_13265 [Hymenobacter lutimineralis]|uniref:DUF3829 domain-containing protein n=1 Tax=Hymenobacter lutimineralis TaxID=2606448 RepID=A0A5D6V0E7_9BACT|nr:hypothetical protein [Hymenobacter lutimineralis]TYZ08412.1 hypothetical protein FY528_13265 [Hymenobacter lutimineralis]